MTPFFAVLRVVNVAPQVQVTSVTPYLGWMSDFTVRSCRSSSRVVAAVALDVNRDLPSLPATVALRKTHGAGGGFPPTRRGVLTTTVTLITLITFVTSASHPLEGPDVQACGPAADDHHAGHCRHDHRRGRRRPGRPGRPEFTRRPASEPGPRGRVHGRRLGRSHRAGRVDPAGRRVPTQLRLP